MRRIQKKIFLFLLLLFLGLFLFWKKDSAVKTLIKTKFKENETVASVLKQITTRVISDLQVDLQRAGFDQIPDQIKLLAFKEERVLVLLGQKEAKWKVIKTYPFTGYSGTLGPKLKEGDLQIPEGLYQISFLNPNSAYHLSMKVNYPNAFDRQKAKTDGRTQLGGDIFIHGKNVTIGCISVGDSAIEELFVVAAHAIDHGIDLIIAPRDFREQPEFPEIEYIFWEKELYTMINNALAQIE